MKPARLKLLRASQVTSRPTQSTATLDRAIEIIKSASKSQDTTRAGASVATPSAAPVSLAKSRTRQAGLRDAKVLATVQLERGLPIHLLPNRAPQPWELLPMKAVAFRVYPNMFATSCMFFSSLQRDVARHRPFCLLRPTRLGIDLAKIMRNLGIVESFEIWQRPNLAISNDQRWPSGAEPEDEVYLRLFPLCYLKLNIRWDQHRPLWLPPDTPASQQPLHTANALPVSTTLISKPSRPVLMTLDQLAAARLAYPPGIFVCFHHEMGLIVDAAVELHSLPAVLVLAHVALPVSQTVQIRGALRMKHLAERAAGSKPLPLTRWNMLSQLQQSISQRAEQLASSVRAQQEVQAIKKAQHKVAEEEAKLIAESELVTEQLNDELTAWLLRDRLTELALAQQAGGQGELPYRGGRHGGERHDGQDGGRGHADHGSRSGEQRGGSSSELGRGSGGHEEWTAP